MPSSLSDLGNRREARGKAARMRHGLRRIVGVYLTRTMARLGRYPNALADFLSPTGC